MDTAQITSYRQTTETSDREKLKEGGGVVREMVQPREICLVDGCPSQSSLRLSWLLNGLVTMTRAHIRRTYHSALSAQLFLERLRPGDGGVSIDLG
jgi:hypothetical protein